VNRQTGSAKLASPFSADLSAVNPRLLTQYRVPGKTRLANLAPPIWLNERGLAHSSKQEDQGQPGVNLGSTWGQPGVNLGSTWVNLGSIWGQPAAACLGNVLEAATQLFLHGLRLLCGRERRVVPSVGNTSRQRSKLVRPLHIVLSRQRSCKYSGM
jgi:hypothetical protein